MDSGSVTLPARLLPVSGRTWSPALHARLLRSSALVVHECLGASSLLIWVARHRITSWLHATHCGIAHRGTVHGAGALLVQLSG
jgi:hypothetical protein